MTEFVFVAGLIYVLITIVSPSKYTVERTDHLELLLEIKRFLIYLEDHLDELPVNVKERFTELNKYAADKNNSRGATTDGGSGKA